MSDEAEVNARKDCFLFNGIFYRQYLKLINFIALL